MTRKLSGVVRREAAKRFLVQQGSVCAICARAVGGGTGRYAIDHCHTTGRPRALLCVHCNSSLGMIREDPAVALRLLLYSARCREFSKGGYAEFSEVTESSCDAEAALRRLSGDEEGSLTIDTLELQVRREYERNRVARKRRRSDPEWVERERARGRRQRKLKRGRAD